MSAQKVVVTRPKAPTLASKGEQVAKEEVISRHKTRGLERKANIIEPDEQETEGSRRKRKPKV